MPAFSKREMVEIIVLKMTHTVMRSRGIAGPAPPTRDGIRGGDG
eukprot:SAG25_NODE_6225_length_577_cov_1.288703_2_plen_43_part_01